MSTNVLLSEYRARLASGGALFCCDPQKPSDKPEDRFWTAPLGGIFVSIRLSVVNGEQGHCMVPRASATGTLAGDALMVAVIAADAQATLQRALSCLASVGDVRVWIADCPCGSCSATGKTSGGACRVCNGTGKRQEPAT